MNNETMKFRQATVVLVAASLGFSFCAHTQTAETPERAYEQYYAAVQKSGWDAIPDFAHPDEAERFREMVMPALATVKGREMRDTVFGSEATVASIGQLPAREFLRRFVLRFSVLMKSVGVVTRERSVVLGVVREGELVHVVARTRTIATNVPLEVVELTTFKPVGSGWAILLPPEIDSLARGMQRLK